MAYRDPAKRRQQSAAWSAAHPERMKALLAAWYQRNRPRLLEKSRIRNALWRAAHPEQVRAYYAENPERSRKNGAAWEKANPEKRRSISQRRRARRAAVPVNDFTAAQWKSMKAIYGYRCVYCARKMTRLSMDHITPLSKGGSHTLSNIVPACQSCNSRKHTGAPAVPVQPLFLL